jgi:DNA-binding XRE family transcriptional regulator
MRKSRSEVEQDIERMKAESEKLAARLKAAENKLNNQYTVIPTFYEGIGLKIRERRKECKISATELGTKIGRTRCSIVNIEFGRQKPSILCIYQIAYELQVNPIELLPENNKTKP